ncbi:DUF6495 family protein [Capnocytophaga canis]|uniref:DUF6495 family protein n=1 Tax=Capnocytophaga canis TaxID=1848903 RepID=UPI001562C8F8|nr:DUF6495 family protein [Capnocytophaga canis]
MKYTRLTKEQLEALHHDFAVFLATQQITADEWEQLKKEKKHIAEEEIDIFSNLVWEKSLQKVSFLERIDKKSIHCFHFQDTNAKMISVQVSDGNIDLTEPEGFLWLKKNMLSDDVQLFTGEKTYTTERNMEIFNLIQQGMQISDGQLFISLNEMLN